MSTPASFIYTPDQVREIDRIAIDELGIPGYELMRRAGQCVFEVARMRHPTARRWLVLCGAGNNAGDGYVIARVAKEAGIDVTVAALSDPQRLPGTAALAWRDFRETSGGVVQFTERLCSETDLVIDALLGTGLARPLEGAYLHAVQSVNNGAAPVISVDIPSGLNGTSGETMGAAVQANVTVTFIGRKLGLYVGAGPECTGEILFCDLGVPLARVAHVTPRMRLFDETAQRRMLPRRGRAAHKGDFGHVLVVGGNHGMAGAVRLAGEAALRAGAGLVTVATQRDHVAIVTGFRPELMCLGVSGAAEMQSALARASVVAIGPGLGRDEWARELFAAATSSAKALVVDADALNLLAVTARRNDVWILTPHPGEAARLLGCSAAAIQADRLGAVQAIAERFGGVCLLKGRCTLVARTGDLPYVIDAGNPGMATAGMGDVLTGVVAGLLAQSRAEERFHVSACAAYVHARAGDAAASAGERGMIAGDLLARLRPWLNPAP